MYEKPHHDGGSGIAALPLVGFAAAADRPAGRSLPDVPALPRSIHRQPLTSGGKSVTPRRRRSIGCPAARIAGPPRRHSLIMTSRDSPIKKKPRYRGIARQPAGVGGIAATRPWRRCVSPGPTARPRSAASERLPNRAAACECDDNLGRAPAVRGKRHRAKAAGRAPAPHWPGRRADPAVRQPVHRARHCTGRAAAWPRLNPA